MAGDDLVLTRFVAPAAPEPAAWALLIAGCGIAGGALRARRCGRSWRGPASSPPSRGAQAAFGAWPDAAATQPVTWAGAGDPPALLLAGAADATVMPRNAAALAAKLRAGGVAAEVELYPGIGHAGIVTALARPLRGRAPVLRDVAGFVTRVTE